MSRLGWWKRAVVVLAVFVAAATAFAASAFAVTGTYSASVTSTSSVRAGNTTAGIEVKVKVTNTSSTSTSYKLGSANAKFTGFTLGAAAIDAAGTNGGNHWTAAVSGGDTLTFRTPETTSSNYLAPGKYVTATVTMTLAPQLPNNYTVVTGAKNDGDYDASALTRSIVDPTVEVKPGPLDHFLLDSIGNQQAGAPIDVRATAYDKYSNQKTDYLGGATVGSSPSPTTLTTTTTPSPGPVYGAFGTWTFGRATASVTAFKAETVRKVTVSDWVSVPSVVVSAQSTVFDVGSGPLTKLAFGQQPSNAAKNTAIDPSVTVVGTDDWGNAASGLVSLMIDSGPLNAVLTGGDPQQLPATSPGFNNLKLNPSGTYKLRATAVGVTPTVSNAFVVSDVQCVGTSCPISVPKNTSFKVDTSNSQTIGLSLLAPSFPECGSRFTPDGYGVTAATATVPSLTTVTIIFDKSVRQASPDNGVAHYNVCFGGIAAGAPVTKFPVQLGWDFVNAPADPAVDDLSNTFDGQQWGILPSCSDPRVGSATNPTSPCEKSTGSAPGGGATIVFLVPAPWDWRGGGG